MAGGLTKYIITGHIIEIYSYKNYFHGKGGNTGIKKGCADLENKLKNYANTNQRRRDTIRRLACCNFNNKYDKFLTLTNAIEHVDNIGAYVLKYITKDKNDERLMGQKAYLTSRNLNKPEEVLNHNLKDFFVLEDKIIQKYNLNCLKPIYESNYTTEILGECEYKQYNLER